MLTEFIEKKLTNARYEMIEDKSFYGEIPGLKGVWANGKTLEECRAQLKAALEDWIMFTLKDGGSIPGIKIVTSRKSIKAGV